MFRRLAESFETDTSAHTSYLEQQDKYFKAIPYMIPSATAGIKGFANAIQSVDPSGGSVQPPAVPSPDQIFRPVVSQALRDRIAQCESSSLDQLIAMRNPSLAPGEMSCGWLYTPPPAGSPYPQVSKGYLGNEQGPVSGFTEYKKWFFDLQLAKKQVMIDKCKALKACTDVDSEVFKGNCGYCTTTNQGVPIDQTGKPLYPSDGMSGCQADAVITSATKCPPRTAENGPQAAVDRTCEPVNGRLSSTCLYRMVMSGGCKDNGSLAVALSSSDPNRDLLSLRNSDTVKIYNRVANPPLSMDIFQQGNSTTDQVLREVRQLASAANQGPETSALGAAARDLCLRKGAVSKYDLCNDIADTTNAPFSLLCLQRLFLSMGGQAAGTMYPSSENQVWYNSLGTWGAVKQSLQQLSANTRSSEYATQRDAMIQFLGITPEKSIQRAPYAQGVEVFWFVPVQGNPNRVAGFLRRTIERDIVQFQAGPSRFAPIGGGAFGCMLQLTDIRASSDFTARFDVTVDDGFWIAVNQPADVDKSAMNQNYADRPGLFENLGLQGATLYRSKSCSVYKASTPNVTKVYYEDAGGGGSAFQVNASACSGTTAFQPPSYSLTCEARAPFLTYEVGTRSGVFEETRNPGLFGQFLGIQALDYHVRPEERERVPGKKGFVRITPATALIDMPNIAFQSWRTMTCAIRLQTMPVKDTLIKLAIGKYFYSVVLTPVNGSIAQVSIEHNLRGAQTTQATSFRMSLNTWYIVGIHNWGTGLTLFISGMEDLIANKGVAQSVRVDTVTGERMFRENGTWAPAPGQPGEACTVMLGSKGFTGRPDWPGMYATSTFQYDLAWIHFFQQTTSAEDIVREASANWIYTAFPSGDGVYSTGN